MNAITKQESTALQLSEGELIEVLATSLYPGASVSSIKMVLSYCKASGLDPMQKPVHIVPMWDGKTRMMRDVIMPGIGLYRTQAARTGCVGITEPDYGPDVTETIGGASITYPQWCRVTVKRRLQTGDVAEFTAKEFWKENYAVRGGQEKSIAPNAMWSKRPYGQIAKCAEAQALRKAFPEIGSEPTADEMAGKTLHDDDVVIDGDTGEVTGRKPEVKMPMRKQSEATDATPKAEATDHAQPEKVATKQAPTNEPATAGEIAYLNKKITAKNWTVAQAFEAAGLDKGDTLDGLTKEGFNSIKAVVA